MNTNKQEGEASLAGSSEMSYEHSEQLTLTKKEIDGVQKCAILLTWTYKFGRI